MLVLVSFVLVLAAAVTLVVGLLQSGLTLIYLSIACSVLAGVVLAVAVLRGRPEPRPAAAGGRSFSPPQRAQVPAAVGASSTETTSSWSSPPVTTSPQPTPPPPPPPPAAPAPAGEDLATRAAGSALLGRLRGRRAEQEAGGEPTAVATPAPASAEPEPAAEPAAAATAVMSAPVAPTEAADGFPIDDYDRMRATELLAVLPGLDRNQLEAVRSREASGKNRFTIMSRVDALLASKEEPAWEAADDDWEDGVGTDAESEAAAIESEALRDEAGFGAALDEEEGDEVDELVSPAPAAASAGFPIAGYETLTVGQILPRLSELDAGELAQVRARELQGRNRGTVLDRIDRLSARAAAPSGAMAMPAASAPARKSPARKAPAAAAKKSPARRATKAALPVPAPAATPAKAARKSPARKAAVAPVVPATKAVRKSPARKTAAAPVAPVVPAPAKASMKDAVKKARGTKKG